MIRNIDEVEVRKRPGTVGICAAIMNKYTVDTVPHLICGGFSVNETEDALINLRYLGIDNVLVLRGDAAKNESAFEPELNGHRYASDLLKQVTNLNAGIYLEDDLKGTQQTNFCIGVAGYPEKHFEAPNMQTDLKFLKAKVDAGADYICTQLFFDNHDFYDFCERCEIAGIKIPIIAGIMPITSLSGMKRMSELALGARVPAKLLRAVLRAENDQAVEKFGTHWAAEQVFDLYDNHVSGIHLYTLNRSSATLKIYETLGMSMGEAWQVPGLHRNTTQPNS